MITEHDLQEAIAECQGERNPNANTCIKLAAFYTIRNELFSKPEAPVTTYSYAPAPEPVHTGISYYSETEFGQLVSGRDPSDVWPLVDELVSDVIRVINPRLYDGFMRRLQ